MAVSQESQVTKAGVLSLEGHAGGGWAGVYFTDITSEPGE